MSHFSKIEMSHRSSSSSERTGRTYSHGGAVDGWQIDSTDRYVGAVPRGLAQLHISGADAGPQWWPGPRFRAGRQWFGRPCLQVSRYTEQAQLAPGNQRTGTHDRPRELCLIGRNSALPVRQGPRGDQPMLLCSAMLQREAMLPLVEPVRASRSARTGAIVSSSWNYLAANTKAAIKRSSGRSEAEQSPSDRPASAR